MQLHQCQPTKAKLCVAGQGNVADCAQSSVAKETGDSLKLACKAHGHHVVHDIIHIQEGVIRPRVAQLHSHGKGILHGFYQVVAAQGITPTKRGRKLCKPPGITVCI